MELQYLNATKSDHGGTSVGVSDAKLRFLGLKSYGIINVAFISLVLNLLIFFILPIAGQLLAFIFSLIMFIHVLFLDMLYTVWKDLQLKKGSLLQNITKRLKLYGDYLN